MKKVMVLFSKGYEETEALLVVTYLRRAGIPTDIVSTVGTPDTVGDHGVVIRADKLWEDIRPADYDALVTPGGYPGAEALAADKRVTETVRAFYEEGKLVASICAGPIVLQAAGIAGEIEGVCYPGCEEAVGFKQAHEEIVHIDRNVITARGPLTAPFFALAIIRYLAGEEKAGEVAEQILFSRVHAALQDCTCFI